MGIETNVCRYTFNTYGVITQFAKLAAGEQVCRRSTHSASNVSPEKPLILSCGTFVANERYVRNRNPYNDTNRFEGTHKM